MKKIRIISVSGGKDSTATLLKSMELNDAEIVPVFADSTFFAPIKKGILNNIDDVVKWSKTKHGGREEREDLQETPKECSSSYGLCE